MKEQNMVIGRLSGRSEPIPCKENISAAAVVVIVMANATTFMDTQTWMIIATSIIEDAWNGTAKIETLDAGKKGELVVEWIV